MIFSFRIPSMLRVSVKASYMLWLAAPRLGKFPPGWNVAVSPKGPSTGLAIVCLKHVGLGMQDSTIA